GSERLAHFEIEDRAEGNAEAGRRSCPLWVKSRHCRVWSGHHLATSHPPDDGLSDLIRRIFLNEMDPLDCHLSLRRQASRVFENLAVGEDSAGLSLQE